MQKTAKTVGGDRFSMKRDQQKIEPEVLACEFFSKKSQNEGKS